MATEIILDALTKDSVTIKKVRVFEDDGEVFRMPPHAKAYINSIEGRAELTDEVPEPYLSAVMAVWGNEPTIQAEAEPGTDT